MNKTKFFGSLLVAALFASTSVFTSCKDYDDDINHLQTEIDGLRSSLKADLDALQSKLTADLNSAKSELQTAINNKADASTVNDLVGRVSALETQLKAVNDALANYAKKSDLDDYAKKSDLDDYAKKSEMDGFVTYAALTGELDALKGLIGDEAGVREAADKNLQLQITALQTWKQTIDEADYQGQLNALQDWQKEVIAANYPKQINDLDTKLSKKISDLAQELSDFKGEYAKDQDELSKKMNGFSQDISKLSIEINILNVLVNKILTSISLVPDLYVNGIEAIEFKSLRYQEVAPGTSGEVIKKVSGKEVAETLIDNGTATATYRLNPATVKLESLDVDKIEYKAATAEVRETRAVSDWSPVLFNGIKEFKNGLMTVYLKKNTIYSLYEKYKAEDGKYYDIDNRGPKDENGKNLGNNKIWIVALNVPRKADAATGQEAADVISENSRLVETTIWPRIARLTWNENLNKSLVKDDEGNLSPIHHYSDSTTLWNSKVDADQMVYDEVLYNKEYNLYELVTGCFDRKAKTDNEITKEDLKTYGLTFRFAIPTKEYKNDVLHVTDQQQFAVVDPVTGIVTSKLPNGVTDNKACVGKEPIIRIDLVDTVNNKLVDQRYCKIKWVEKKFDPIALDPYSEETVLKPCDTNVAGGIKWEWFITKVYAKAAEFGLSQTTFDDIYPTIKYSLVSADPANGTPTLLNDAGDYTKCHPIVKPTTNEQGDALIAEWSMEPQDIARIYPSQSKKFTCTITFESRNTILYPDLTLEYSWIIKLPDLPKINGYYDNYWFEKYATVDVLPVQYKTALYDKIAAGKVVPMGTNLETYNKMNNTVVPGVDYCVYYNNLLNAFTFEEKNGSPYCIVKGLYDLNNSNPENTGCAVWDIQFTKSGKDKFAGELNGDKKYSQFDGYTPDFIDTNSPELGKHKDQSYDSPLYWKTYGAYRLKNSSNKQALQLCWDFGDATKLDIDNPYNDIHCAWCWNFSHRSVNLYADHHNAANQALINPLSDEYEADNLTPKRTHDKKIHMGIWATLNDWNIIPVKDYDICLVAPLRIDANLGGAFEEGYVSGTAVECDAAFTMTDFRGYTVSLTNGSTEWTKYARALWTYYEVESPVWDLDKVKYGMKKADGNVVPDDNLTWETGMTAKQIETATSGNIVFSVTREYKNGKSYLVFRNNVGSNVEGEVNVFIPVTVKYGFGEVTKYCKVRLYPKGKVPADVRIIPF